MIEKWHTFSQLFEEENMSAAAAKKRNHNTLCDIIQKNNDVNWIVLDSCGLSFLFY